MLNLSTFDPRDVLLSPRLIAENNITAFVQVGPDVLLAADVGTQHVHVYASNTRIRSIAVPNPIDICIVNDMAYVLSCEKNDARVLGFVARESVP